MTDSFRRVAAATGLVFLFLSVSASLTGCACGFMDLNRFGGSASCNQQMAAEREAESQKRLAQIPSLQKRADSGDVQAQIELASFHVFESHPNSDRKLGLFYYQKAAMQGDVHSHRIYVTENYNDCQRKARDLGTQESLSPQYAPHCLAEWASLETLAKKHCARSFKNDSNMSLAALVGDRYRLSDKRDDADFWFVTAMTFCITPEERASLGDKALVMPKPYFNWSNDSVRAIMWTQILGQERVGSVPANLPDVGEQAKQRLVMLREKVARSGIRPAP